MVTLPDIDLEYLKIPQYLYEKIHHDEHYIKNGYGKKAVRKIYSNANYDDFELSHIRNLQNLIRQSKITFPQKIIQEDRLLRYLYSGGFEIEKAFEILQSHFEWLSNPENFKIFPKTKEYLEKGAVYLAGRDKKYRPIIIINVKMLYGKEFDLTSFMNAMYVIFNISRELIFVPGKIENWILIIETSEMSLMSFPFDVLGKIITNASLQYSGTMEKIYITNPSTSLNFCWAIIAKFMDDRTLNKINKLKKNEFQRMLEYIPEDQLEMKYGGKMEDIVVFWPPIDSLKDLKYRTHSSNEIAISSVSPLRDTKKRIFDDSQINRSHSPFLHEEIEEIISHRKTKNSPMKKDLYENFEDKMTKKSAHHQKKKNNFSSDDFPENHKNYFKNGHENHDFKSMYSEFYNEKKIVTEKNSYNKRDNGFCGLCFSARKKEENQNGQLESSRNMSACSIF